MTAGFRVTLTHRRGVCVHCGSPRFYLTAPPQRCRMPGKSTEKAELLSRLSDFPIPFVYKGKWEAGNDRIYRDSDGRAADAHRALLERNSARSRPAWPHGFGAAV